MAGVLALGAMRRRLACDIYVPSLFRSRIISSPPLTGFPSRSPYSSSPNRCLPYRNNVHSAGGAGPPWVFQSDRHPQRSNELLPLLIHTTNDPRVPSLSD